MVVVVVVVEVVVVATVLPATFLTVVVVAPGAADVEVEAGVELVDDEDEAGADVVVAAGGFVRPMLMIAAL